MSVGGVFAAVQLVLAVALNRLAVNRHRSRSYGRMIQAQWADEAGTVSLGITYRCEET